MAKNPSPRKDKKTENYYKLNTEAVDRLVNAEENVKNKAKQAPLLKDPAKQYRSSFLDRIPAPVKALFIKWWFVAAICYFFLWSGLFGDYLDMIVGVSIVIGVITDILTNNALRFIETLPGENNKWMMFPQKKYWTFLANILYAFVVFYCVFSTYVTVNVFINSLTGEANAVPMGVEPILFGAIYLLFDLLFIGMKHLMKTIITDAKNKVNKQ